MPNGSAIRSNTFGEGDLNAEGEVAFVAALTGGQADSGIFLYSGGRTSKIMGEGDATPIGGTFLTQVGLPIALVMPRLNDNSAVAFNALVANGNAPSAIFLASPRAMVKVVAPGDQLPSGETIRVIDTFALNDLGEVAFFAYGKKNKTRPLGVFVARPVAPTISRIKLKRKSSGLQLRVNGSAMITNDTVIEINRVPLEALEYPSDFRVDGGFTTRLVSRDPRLDQLLQQGQTVQVTLFNSLTNLRSAPRAFTR